MIIIRENKGIYSNSIEVNQLYIMLEGLWIFSSVHNNNALFKCKQKITDQKGNNGATDVEIIWGILEML